jgi:hypothetical protein
MPPRTARRNTKGSKASTPDDDDFRTDPKKSASSKSAGKAKVSANEKKSAEETKNGPSVK